MNPAAPVTSIFDKVFRSLPFNSSLSVFHVVHRGPDRDLQKPSSPMNRAQQSLPHTNVRRTFAANSNTSDYQPY